MHICFLSDNNNFLFFYIYIYGISRLMVIEYECLTPPLIDMIFSGVRYTEKIKQIKHIDLINENQRDMQIG